MSIDIKFKNRVDELEAICKPSAPPLIVIDAPAGYGKTWLLREAKSRYEKKKWNAIWVDLKEKNQQILIESYVYDKIGAGLSTKIDSNLEIHIAKAINIKYIKIILFFDNVHTLDKEELKWLKNKVFECKKGVNIANFRVIFSGRYITSGDKRLIWQRFNIPLHFLSPFTYDHIREILEETITPPRKRNELLDRCIENAKHIEELSCGHPKIITQLIRELIEEKGWALELSDNEEKQKLFEKYINPQLKEILGDSLKEKCITVLETVVIFRVFNQNTVEKLVERGILINTGGLSSFELIQKLGLVSQKGGFGFCSDAIVRKLILLKMKLNDRDRYIKLNKVAHEIYDAWVNELVKDTPSYIDRESYLQFLVKESIYHICQLSVHNEADKDNIKKCLNRYKHLQQDYVVEKGKQHLLKNILLSDKGITLEEEEILELFNENEENKDEFCLMSEQSGEKEECEATYTQGILRVLKEKQPDRSPYAGTAFTIKVGDSYYIITCGHVLYAIANSTKRVTDCIRLKSYDGEFEFESKVTWIDEQLWKGDKLNPQLTAKQDICILTPVKANIVSHYINSKQFIKEDIPFSNYANNKNFISLEMGNLSASECCCYGYGANNQMDYTGRWLRNISIEEHNAGDQYKTIEIENAQGQNDKNTNSFEDGDSGAPLLDTKSCSIVGMIQSKKGGKNAFLIPSKKIHELVTQLHKKEGYK